MSNSANWKKQKIQLRRGTSAEWVSRNTLLLPGEVGYETDTGRQKIGDGVTRWNQLAYWVGGGVAPDDPRLTDSREWSADTIAQAEAEAGSSTTRRAFTAQRVFQAIAAWWNGTTDKQKLDGIASGATANSSDAHLLARQNHTGTQAISTVTDLQGALDAKAPLANPSFTGTVSGITKTMVGLGNVDNTSDADKPISTATQTALNAKAPINNPTFTGTVSGVTKSMVGLGNVDNTSDLNKPISTATQTALDGKQAAGSYATLVNGLVPTNQLPGFVDDVLEYANVGDLPGTGVAGVLYVLTAENKVYRWSGTQYIEIVGSPGTTDAVAEGTTNLYYTDARAAAAAPVQSVAGKQGTVTLAKGDVGLGNVDNTSDLDKPISYLTQTALDGKVNTTDSRLTNSRAPTGPAGGELVGDYPNPLLNNTGVSSGTYGSASQVATFSVNASGRLLSASNTSIAISSAAVSGLAPSATTDTTNADNITAGTVAYSRIPVGSTTSTVCAGDDARLSDARTPTAHKASHATGGSDALTPGDIGAAPAASPAITGNATFSASSGVPVTVTNTGSGNSFVVNDAAGDTTPFVVDADGKVGIRGATPSSLHSLFNTLCVGAGGAAAQGITIFSQSVCTLAFGDTAAGDSADSSRGYVSYSHTTDTLTIGTNNATRITVDSTGKVGVNRPSPASTLDVNGVITVSATSGSAGSYAPSLTFSGDANTGFGQVSGQSDSASIFTAGHERVRVTNAGTVGIGTSSIDAGVTLDARGTIQAKAAGVKIQAVDSSVIVKTQASNATSEGIVGTESNHNLAIRANNVAALRVKSTGAVRFVPLSADPASGEAGDVYYNSSTNKLRVYNGTSWVDLH